MKIQKPVITAPTITDAGSLEGSGANLTGSFSGAFDASSFASDGLGIVSASAQTIAHLPGGTVSGSAQTVANLPAGTISGSAQVSLSGFDTDDLGEGSTNKYASTTNVKAALNADLGGTATIGDSSDTIVIAGNLTVQGTETTLNTAQLVVEDKLISVASGAADNSAANGAGLHVSGSDAEFTYASSGDKWTMNKNLDLGSNTITTTGAIAGATLNTGQGANELYAMDQAVQTTDDVQFNDVQIDSLGIGTAASGTSGEIRATNDITAFYSSDERLKENIADLEGALDKVKAIRGVTFDWKELSEEERKTIHSHEGHDLGVIAQEVQAVYPELVHQRDHGYLSVDYVKLTAVLIQAVKELSAKVEELSK